MRLRALLSMMMPGSRKLYRIDDAAPRSRHVTPAARRHSARAGILGRRRRDWLPAVIVKKRHTSGPFLCAGILVGGVGRRSGGGRQCEAERPFDPQPLHNPKAAAISRSVALPPTTRGAAAAHGARGAFASTHARIRQWRAAPASHRPAAASPLAPHTPINYLLKPGF